MTLRLIRNGRNAHDRAKDVPLSEEGLKAFHAKHAEKLAALGITSVAYRSYRPTNDSAHVLVQLYGFVSQNALKTNKQKMRTAFQSAGKALLPELKNVKLNRKPRILTGSRNDRKILYFPAVFSLGSGSTSAA